MRYRIINKDIMRALLASYYLTKYHRMSFEER